MRTITLILIFIGTSFFAFAQEEPLLSKKGRVILPEKGDFAVGLSANPFFDYAGNLLSSSGNNTLRSRLLDNNVFFSKYFISDKLALRLKLRLNQGKSTLTNKVVSFASPSAQVEDKLEQKSSVLEFTPGIEFRSGSSRLQVAYGGEIIIAKDKIQSSYTYGNNFATNNTSPLSTIDFNNKTSGFTTSRPTESIPTDNFRFGIRAFIGLEYFFAPKMSVGSEIGLGYSKVNGGDTRSVSEFWDVVQNQRRLNTISGAGGDSRNLGTDTFNGQIFVLFYL